MHQAHADDAKERQIAREAIGGFQQTVLDLATGFEHLVPGLDAPAPGVPLNLLDRRVKVSYGQVRQQHPADGLGAPGAGLFRRRDDVHADRLHRRPRLWRGRVVAGV